MPPKKNRVSKELSLDCQNIKRNMKQQQFYLRRQKMLKTNEYEKLSAIYENIEESKQRVNNKALKYIKRHNAINMPKEHLPMLNYASELEESHH